MYDFVVVANRSSNLHIDAKLMVTQECLLEPNPINPEDAGNMILKKGQYHPTTIRGAQPQRTAIRMKDAAQKHVI